MRCPKGCRQKRKVGPPSAKQKAARRLFKDATASCRARGLSRPGKAMGRCVAQAFKNMRGSGKRFSPNRETFLDMQLYENSLVPPGRTRKSRKSGKK